jgi:hypothetical protein
MATQYSAYADYFGGFAEKLPIVAAELADLFNP